MLKHGILGLLNYQAMTGYEIMEVFRDSLHYFWDAKTSQIYRELQGLEQKEWVGKTVVPQSGKPDKNVYSITAEGRAELLRWLADADLGSFVWGREAPGRISAILNASKSSANGFLRVWSPSRSLLKPTAS